MPSTCQNLQPLTGYGDVSIWVKNARVGRKTLKTNKQANKNIHVLNTTLTFDLKVKLIIFDMSSCPTCNLCLLWQWHIIYDTWIYHYDKMCCKHSWKHTTLTFDLKVKFIGFWHRIWDIHFLSFDTVTPY